MMDKARSPSLKTWDTCILMPFVVIIICICCTHCINHCINHTRHIHPEDRVQLSIHGYLCSRYVVHHPWTLFPNRLPFCYSYLPLVTFFTLVIIARLLYLLSHLSSYLCRAEELWDWNKGFVNHHSVLQSALKEVLPLLLYPLIYLVLWLASNIVATCIKFYDVCSSCSKHPCTGEDSMTPWLVYAYGYILGKTVYTLDLSATYEQIMLQKQTTCR